MKRQVSLTLIMSLFFVAQILAQKKYPTQFEVQYEVSYSPDTLDLAKKNSTTLYLYTSKDYGVFMNSFKANEKERNAKTRERVLKRAGAKAAENMTFQTSYSSGGVMDKVFYKVLQNKNVKVVGGLAGITFVFSKPETFASWKIGDETKKVGDYTARKATTNFAGRDYVAWFTLKIPIPDGPYIFSGLPGLIVELYDTRDDYHFTLKSIYKLDKPNTWTIPEDAKSVTKAKFEKLEKKAKKNQRSFGDIVENNIQEGILESGVDPSKLKKGQNTYTVNGKKMSKGEFHRYMKGLNKNEKTMEFNNPIELK